MILKSMKNLVGFATNVMSMTFALKDREMVAHKLGFKTIATMDEFLDYAIKVGTDGFKTSVDMDGVERRLNMIQSNLQRMGIRSPWSGWPNDNAFRRFVPYVLIEKVDTGKPLPKGCAYWYVQGETEPVFLTENEIENSVMPWWDGTIATITRMTLPSLKSILDTPIKTRPLTEFRNWAMKVTELQYGTARVVQDWFNARIQRVNFSDPENIAKFKAELQVELVNWTEREQLDLKVAASALWRVAHSSRSDRCFSGVCVHGFPGTGRMDRREQARSSDQSDRHDPDRCELSGSVPDERRDRSTGRGC